MNGDACVEFGAEYKDIVSGFRGIAIAEHRYMNGCTQVSLKPKVTSKSEKPPETWSFDIQQLERVGTGVISKLKKNKDKLAKAVARKPGGADGPSPAMQ